MRVLCRRSRRSTRRKRTNRAGRTGESRFAWGYGPPSPPGPKAPGGNPAGVRGWVRNRSDGSVEAVLQGSAQAVDAVIAWAHRGPAAARVVEVQVRDPAPEFDRPYSRFERWPGA